MPTVTVRTGLWYVTVCSETLGECRTHSVGSGSFDPYSDADSSMLEFQIEATLALICSLASVVLGFIIRNTENEHRRRELVNGLMILLLSSGLLALIASGTMADHIRKVHMAVSRYVGYSLFGFPYSLVLTGVGGILQVVACILKLLSGKCGANNEQRHVAVNRYCPNMTYTLTSPDTISAQPMGHQYFPANVQTQPYQEQGQERKQIPDKDPDEAPPPYNP